MIKHQGIMFASDARNEVGKQVWFKSGANQAVLDAVTALKTKCILELYDKSLSRTIIKFGQEVLGFKIKRENSDNGITILTISWDSNGISTNHI